MATLFDRVKALADKQKISIVELEEKLDFGRNYLYKWKSPSANPSKEAIEKVADFFHVSTDYLLGRDFPERLRNLRIKNVLSQSDVARKIGVSTSTYSAYESGNRAPDQKTLKSISNIFDVSIDYLLGSTDKRHYYSLTEKDTRAVDEKIKDIIDGLDPNGPDFFKQDAELSDEDKRLLSVSLRQSYALAQELAKKKYTPKKYRGSEK